MPTTMKGYLYIAIRITATFLFLLSSFHSTESTSKELSKNEFSTEKYKMANSPIVNKKKRVRSPRKKDAESENSESIDLSMNADEDEEEDEFIEVKQFRGEKTKGPKRPKGWKKDGKYKKYPEKKMRKFGRALPENGTATAAAAAVEKPKEKETKEGMGSAYDLVRTFGKVNAWDDFDDENEKPDSFLNAAPVFRVRYLREDEISHPILKHFTLYKADFYPPWTYFGFFPPVIWHKIPIEYFTRNKEFDQERLKKHQSEMNICSNKVTSNSVKCQEIMKNECISDLPSPINIITSEAEVDPDYNDFLFSHFDKFFEFTMFLPDDGTDMLFLQLLASKRSVNTVPQMSQGSVKNAVLGLDRISFHFGKDRFNGSQHLINGKQYAMEIMLYFTGDGGAYWESLAKCKFMKAEEGPISKQVNMHVLSVMVEVPRPGATTPDDPDAKFAERFDVLSSAASMFWESKNPKKFRSVQVNQKLLSLKDILEIPSNTGLGMFYSYEGSLTHPPCLKHARYTVFEKPIWITYEQWLRFAVIHSEFSDENFLAGNFRLLDDIMLKVDIPTYLEMRKIEGLGTPNQKELDLEIRKYNEDVDNRTEKELFIFRQYNEFPLYYAKRVRTRRPRTKNATVDDDYYDTISDNLKSGVNSLHEYYNYHYSLWSVAQKSAFSLIVMIKLINFF